VVSVAAAASRGAVQAAVATTLIQSPGASFNSSLGAFLGFAAAPFAQSVLRRLFGRRRVKRRATPSNMQGGATATLSVATFNLRGVMDRWQERQPLLRQCIDKMDADVLCFQECLTGELPCCRTASPCSRPGCRCCCRSPAVAPCCPLIQTLDQTHNQCNS
jgi:hypothetical protein